MAAGKKKKSFNKRRISSSVSTSSSIPSVPMTSFELESKIRAIVNNVTFSIDQSIKSLSNQIENVKSNTIVAISLMEKKGLITRDEYLSAFMEYEETERPVVNGDGTMPGSFVFSLYNCDHIPVFVKRVKV